MGGYDEGATGLILRILDRKDGLPCTFGCSVTNEQRTLLR